VEIQTKRVDLSQAVWRKSTRSGPNCDNCVEVAFAGGAVAVRDSKHPTDAVLVFSLAQWHTFVGGTKGGEFDLV